MQPRVARTLLLVAVAFIVYASVYPVHLHGVSGALMPTLLRTWKAHVTAFFAGDVAANFLLYAPLGFFAFFSVSVRYQGAGSVAIAACLGAALSAGMETIQLFETDRVSSVIDVLANSAGALFGGGVAAKLSRTPVLLARPAPVMLFGSWLAATVLLV